MRSIQVSTDVFARIWALRQQGEDSEDTILKRILHDKTHSKLELAAHAHTAPPPATGFHDSKHNVSFPENFEIFRIYKGTRYVAQASRGRWILRNNGQAYKSLNELSIAVGAKTENAWINWFYLDSHNIKGTVSKLRAPETIGKRENSTIINSAYIAPASSSEYQAPEDDGTWRADVYEAILARGGMASLHDIYKDVEEIRSKKGRTVPRTLEAVIRRILEDHSSDSDNFRGLDLFYMPKGKGAGIWALRSKKRK